MNLSDLARREQRGKSRYCAECGKASLHRFCKRCRRLRKEEGIGKAEVAHKDDDIYDKDDKKELD